MQISSTNLLVASQAAGYLPNGSSVNASGRSQSAGTGSRSFAEALQPQKATDSFSPLNFRAVDARSASIVPAGSDIETAASAAKTSGKYLPPGSIVDITV